MLNAPICAKITNEIAIPLKPSSTDIYLLFNY